MGEPHRLVAELRIRRLLRGLTLGQVSIRTGIPVTTLNGWEMGRYDPPLHRLEVYAAVLGMRVGMLHEEETGDLRAEDHQLRLLRETGDAQGSEVAVHLLVPPRPEGEAGPVPPP